ncbi:hypothetical protein [Streptomyces decoyicus]
MDTVTNWYEEEHVFTEGQIADFAEELERLGKVRKRPSKAADKAEWRRQALMELTDTYEGLEDN